MPADNNTASALFYEWAIPKLRALLDARAKDTRAGLTEASYHFGRLLNHYMTEFEEQPFSRPDFLATHGLPGNSADGLRQSAVRYLVCHSRPEHRSVLDMFESKGHQSEENPFDPCIARELWAAMHWKHIRVLTYRDLGAPLDTIDTAPAPPGYCRQRRAVVQREFGELPLYEQTSWHNLAEERKAAVARGEVDAIAMQDRQSTASSSVYRKMLDTVVGGSAGDSMVITWKGFYAGAEDGSLRYFHGQVSNITEFPQWVDSPQYTKPVDKAWKTFARTNMEPHIIMKRLPELPDAPSPERIAELREALDSFCENIYRLQCKIKSFNKDVFWGLVAWRPLEFVPPVRLPNGIAFRRPSSMEEADFLALYAHVWRSQNNRSSIQPAARFAFDPDSINYGIAIVEANKLSMRLEALKTAALAAAADIEAPIAATHGGLNPRVVAAASSEAPARNDTGMATSNESPLACLARLAVSAASAEATGAAVAALPGASGDNALPPASPRHATSSTVSGAATIRDTAPGAPSGPGSADIVSGETVFLPAAETKGNAHTAPGASSVQDRPSQRVSRDGFDKSVKLRRTSYMEDVTTARAEASTVT